MGVVWTGIKQEADKRCQNPKHDDLLMTQRSQFFFFQKMQELVGMVWNILRNCKQKKVFFMLKLL